MFKRKLAKVIVSLLRRIANVSRAGAKRLMRAMLRSLMAMGRRAKLPVAGFVLPTVTMVMLVVVLLTLAITLRSFDRAQNARNVRVNQQVLAAATPALDRAKAKIQYLLEEDPLRPTGTPTDNKRIEPALSYPSSPPAGTPTDTYTFGDERRLQVRFDLNKNNTIDTSTTLETNETITSAWRFAVDTDNNGKFDSYTIYGIFFRSPERDAASNEFKTSRSPLDARTPPMSSQVGDPACAAALGTSASLVGDSGWYKSEGRLKKSFFVYTATVPITDATVYPNTSNSNDSVDKYEINTGNKGFSALEYQQDRTRLPLLNYAAVYEDDLEISPGPALRMNGAMLTNSNLLVTHTNIGPVTLFQVSGTNSCYYKQENSKILVAGNVVNGYSGDTTVRNPVQVDLYQGSSNPPLTNQTISASNQSVGEDSLKVLYNNKAYSDRLSALVSAQIAANPTPADVNPNDPKSVQKAVQAGTATRNQALQTYFSNLLRKVPFAEVPINTVDSTITGVVIAGTGDTLRPANTGWMLPTTLPSLPNTLIGDLTGPTSLTINAAQLEAQYPDPAQPPQIENYLGDRVVAGNNLPSQWWDDSKTAFIGGASTKQEVGGGAKWTDKPAENRTRTSQKQKLADVGATGRDGFWENAAAQIPKTALSAVGGLRVVTSGGVYERINSFLPPPVLDAATGGVGTYDDPATTTTEAFPVVWPDTMPMSPSQGSKVFNNDPQTTGAPINTAARWVDLTNSPPAAGSIDPNTPKYVKGDLRMRATAVYHYVNNGFDPEATPTTKPSQTPIACVSSYYDNTNSTTARNPVGLADVSGWAGPSYVAPSSPPPQPAAGVSFTNNGIVYGPPTATSASIGQSADGGNGLLAGGDAILANQANLVFPDGRFANEALRNALLKAPADRNLSDQSAIDSTICALGILGTSGYSVGAKPTFLADGVIKEVAFLNGREVKAIDADDPNTPVDETFTLSSPTTTTPLAAPANQAAARLSGNYDLGFEERMPIEIRVTQLNLNSLRNAAIDQGTTTTGPRNSGNQEYLLPYSGIIYATRDDALPDRSDRTPGTDGIDAVTSEINSPNDSRLDPTRRPNGIMLIEGGSLARNNASPDPSTIPDVAKEKGLTLVSDVPVYIQADANNNFNNHTSEEFTTALATDWGNFYSRSGLDPNFACRKGDPRLTTCTAGDNWRAATVLSDSISLLSQNFRVGFRDEGDFDLRNNAGVSNIGYDFDGNGSIETASTKSEIDFQIDLNGNGNLTDTAVKETEVTAKAARQLNGFLNNNFVTNGLSSGSPNFDRTNGSPKDTLKPKDIDYSGSGTDTVHSSYFDNFVTPVQRRLFFPEYVMEICRKLPVSACGAKDWVIGYDLNGNGSLNDNLTAGVITAIGASASDKESDIKTYQLPQSLKTSNSSFDLDATKLGSGTTVLPPMVAADRRFPRRVAFLRKADGKLALDSAGRPLPLGIYDWYFQPNSLGQLKYYHYENPTPTNIVASDFPTISDPTTIISNITLYQGAGYRSPRSPLLTSGGGWLTQGNSLWYRTATDVTKPSSADTTKWNYSFKFPLFYRTTSLPFSADDPAFTTASALKHPLLMPVLQIHTTDRPLSGWPTDDGTYTHGTLTTDVTAAKDVKDTKWLPKGVNNSTFNLVVGGGDTPSRSFGTTGDTNGGLQNLPRFLENWDSQDTNILGSFIQLSRSAFSTAPITTTISSSLPTSVLGYNPANFPYKTDANGGRTPYFNPPNRKWGYDVGLLSQFPDLFAQNYSTPPTTVNPDEFFREVSRNDQWVNNLMCSRLNDDSTKPAVSTNQIPTKCPPNPTP